MRVLKRLTFLFALIILVAGIARIVHAQTSDALYVSETGHWVRGEFLKFYQSQSDPLRLFGYPITEDITDPLNGQVSQYFQRARLDLIVDANGGMSVQPARLGTLLYEEGAPLADVPTNSAACRLFPAANRYVCYAFLQFYDAHNGELLFGDPISDLEVQDGSFVQYFENARMEWHPEMPSGQRVVLSDLGRIYFDKRIGDQAALSPATTRLLVKPKIRAFVSQALIAPNSQQTLFIIVQDQDCRPVEQAMAGIVVRMPDGREEIYRAPLTNTDGISVVNFSVGEVLVKEIVQVDVYIDYLGEQAYASTWFRIWW